MQAPQDNQAVVISVKTRARDKLLRDLGGDFLQAFDDPRTVEIMLNGDGVLWQERLGERMRPIGRMSHSQAEAVIKTVAGYYGKEITRSKPLWSSKRLEK